MKTIIIIIIGILIFFVMIFRTMEKREYTFQYVETPRGIVRYGPFRCSLGLLTNRERINVLDENRNPITCSGYIEITQAQHDIRIQTQRNKQ